jgi:hypothetical protein
LNSPFQPKGSRLILFSKIFGLSMNKMDKNGFGKLFQIDVLGKNGFFDKMVALTMLRRGTISQGERD